MAQNSMLPQSGRRGAKRRVLSEIWDEIKRNGPPFQFDNLMVKTKTGELFRNQFDLTKVDRSEKLPDSFRRDDVFIVHLGGGRHQFVSGIKLGYHALEGPGKEIPWRFKRTLLDDFDSGEAGVLSVVFNEQIAQDFLYDNPRAPVKIHLPGRTHRGEENSFSYRIGGTEVSVRNLQIELDFILEDPHGDVAIAEAKRGDLPADFAVAQIYLPYRKLLKVQERRGTEFRIRPLFAVQFTRADGREAIRIYEYAFHDPFDMGSISHVKSAEYVLMST